MKQKIPTPVAYLRRKYLNLKGVRKRQVPRMAWEITSEDLIELWNMCKNTDGNVKIKVFQETLMKAGMDEDQTKRLIDRWENNNVIKLNIDGTYKRI